MSEHVVGRPSGGGQGMAARALPFLLGLFGLLGFVLSPAHSASSAAVLGRTAAQQVSAPKTGAVQSGPRGRTRVPASLVTASRVPASRVSAPGADRLGGVPDSVRARHHAGGTDGSGGPAVRTADVRLPRTTARRRPITADGAPVAQGAPAGGPRGRAPPSPPM